MTALSHVFFMSSRAFGSLLLLRASVRVLHLTADIFLSV